MRAVGGRSGSYIGVNTSASFSGSVPGNAYVAGILAARKSLSPWSAPRGRIPLPNLYLREFVGRRRLAVRQFSLCGWEAASSQGAKLTGEDWLFASPASKGKLPYWPFSLFRVYVRPALKAAEITGKVGWHTFRHSYATILKSHGEECEDGARIDAARQQQRDIESLRASGDGHQARRAKWQGWFLDRKVRVQSDRRLIGRYRTVIKTENSL